MLLVEGSQGNTVKYLQYGLRIKCFNPKSMDGIFGAATTIAVKRYQTSKGLSADGKVGNGTWNTLKEDIKPIQNALKKKGYYSGTVDGIAGSGTYNALVTFQKEHHLTADGMAGKSTLDELYRNSDEGYPTLKQGSSGSKVKELQKKLIALGYHCGNTGADGDFGAGTVRAVKAFQAANGLTSDGIVGRKSWDVLNSKNAVPNPNTNPTLKRGDKGEYVIKLQEKLIRLGYSCGDGGSDGIYGDDTYHAVRIFQQNNGLTVDGIVGSKTWEKLETASPIGDMDTPLLVLGSTGSSVVKLQKRLLELEYDCGSSGADGKFGSGTKNAVINFQKNNGLNVDGKVGPKTWEKLNSTNAIKGSGTNNNLLREGSSGEAVTKLQERLISLGYSCGSSAADGQFGRNTTLAVIKFQKINGLSADGIVGPKTKTCLYSESAKANDGSADKPVYPTLPTNGSLLEYTIKIISEQEGTYTGINPTDILSIGLLQWREIRAYNLLLDIRNRNIKSFDSLMSQTTIGKYVIANNSEPFKTLKPSSLSSQELDSLKKILDTEESHLAQDELKRNDVNGYIQYGKDLGITDDKVLIYFSDCYNQSPSGIRRIGGKIEKKWSTLSLDELHRYALQDIYMKDNVEKGLGKYPNRRKSVYDKANSYKSSNSSNLSEYVENMVTYALFEETQDRFEGLPESDRGKDNYNKYNTWFPSKQGNAWCACFVSWCANKAGILNVSGQLGLVPKYTAVKDFLKFYQEQNRFGDKATYSPKRGDIFINKSNGYSHVGIVTGYDSNAETFTTIEGNTLDDTVKENTRSMTSSALTGFGINTP